MKPIATADIETDPFRGPDHPEGERLPQAFAAGFYDGKRVQTFWGDDCIQKLVTESLKKDWIVYLHNGGKFDSHFMLAEILCELIRRYGIRKLKLFTIGSRIVSIKTPTAEFRDSYALIPKPLSAFANKGEIDMEKLEPEVRDENRDEILKYLRQDCTSLYDALVSFIQEYGAKLTLASTAFSVLRKKFNMAPVNTDNNFDTFFRRAFFAGRVQFFSLGKHGNLDGKKRYDICDINSAFPWSMVSPHFFSSEYIQLEKVPKRYKEQCFYEISCESFGALPFREKNGGVSFPHRKGDWFVCGWELFTAKKLKLIKNLKIYAIYQPSIINDFSEYISYFYELKKNAKTQADREIAKSFLNSLYGKFAQNNREARDVIVTLYGDAVPIRLTPIKQNKTLINSVRKQLKKYPQKAEDSEHGKIVYTEYGDKCYAFDDENRLCVFEYWQHSYDDESRGLSFWQLPTLTEEENLRFYNVATAASITSKVRAFLAESIHACKTPLYCDTDSIIAADCSPLKKSDELGDWKLELECDAVWIGGKKLYVAHSADDKGQTEKPKGKFFREVHLPQYNFRRWYVTKKDFNKSWKKAHKGARLSIEKMIHVCEGGEATCSFDAPNYSPFSPPKFTRRTVRRDDKRKR